MCVLCVYISIYVCVCVCVCVCYESKPLSCLCVVCAVLSERSCDGVEEHFQRSLGAHYHKSTPPLSISASVDNHFAKALGDKWHQIKGSSSSTSSSPTTPLHPSSKGQVPQGTNGSQEGLAALMHLDE